MTTNTQISVTLTPELRLKRVLKEAGIENPATITRLTVVGRINKDDFEYIRENMRETLLELDLGDASVNGIFVGRGGYKDFYRLRSFTVPDTLSCGISCFDFQGCTALTSITVRPGNPVYTSENGVVFSKDKTGLFVHPPARQGDYTIPAPVRDYVFCYVDNDKLFDMLFAKDYDENLMYEQCDEYCCATVIVQHPHLFADTDDGNTASKYPVTFEEAEKRISKMVTHFLEDYVWDIEYIGSPTSIELSFVEYIGGCDDEEDNMLTEKLPKTRKILKTSSTEHVIDAYDEQFFNMLFAKNYNKKQMMDFCIRQYPNQLYKMCGENLFMMNESTSVSKYEISFSEAVNRIVQMIEYFDNNGKRFMEYDVAPSQIEIILNELNK